MVTGKSTRIRILGKLAATDGNGTHVWRRGPVEVLIEATRGSENDYRVAITFFDTGPGSGAAAAILEYRKTEALAAEFAERKLLQVARALGRAV